MIHIKSYEFGKTKDGKTVTAFELSNSKNTTLRLLDYGCTIQSVIVHDKNNKPRDIVLGYDDIASYEQGSNYLGATVGRVANRIGGGRFILEGKEIVLEKNDGGKNHLHGVYCRTIFQGSILDNGVKFVYDSPDGEEGYPGALHIEILFSLSEDNEISIEYKATSNKTTVVNLTNHSYFNLNGQDGSTIYDHILYLNASRFSEWAPSLAQTGNIIPVEGTPLDFRKEHTIGERINADYYQLNICSGYDHNMILDGEEGALKQIGYLKNPQSGLELDAYTTEPAVLFHSGNYLQPGAAPYGKNGISYPKGGGICLEAQHYPDAVNHPNFPSIVLRKGETYHQKTIYIIKAIG